MEVRKGKATDELFRLQQTLSVFALGIFCVSVGYHSGLKEGRAERDTPKSGVLRDAE